MMWGLNKLNMDLIKRNKYEKDLKLLLSNSWALIKQELKKTSYPFECISHSQSASSLHRSITQIPNCSLPVTCRPRTPEPQGSVHWTITEGNRDGLLNTIRRIVLVLLMMCTRHKSLYKFCSWPCKAVICNFFFNKIIVLWALDYFWLRK